MLRRLASTSLLAALAALTTLAAAGCGGAEPPTATPPPPATTSITAPPPTAATQAPPAPVTPISLKDAGLDPTLMNRGADACQSLYEVACGSFLKNGQIPADRVGWGPAAELAAKTEEFQKSVLEQAVKQPGDDPVMKKLGAWYGACMNEAGIEKAGLKPIKPLLSLAAGVKDAKSLYKAVTALHAQQIFPLFDISSLQDSKDATRVIAGLDQRGLGLPNRDYYLDEDAHTKEIRAFYLGHIERMLTLAGEKPAAAKKAAEDVLQLETLIAKISQDKVVRRDPYKIYNRVDRVGLVTVAKGFPWDAYFAGLGFPDLKEITINSPSYFSGIDELMVKERPETWRSYLTWRVIETQANRLGAAFIKERFTILQKLLGQKEIEPRSRKCMNSTDATLGELLAQRFVLARFSAEGKRAAKDLVGAIRGAMRAEIGGLPWMDDATRVPALEKLTRMNDKIGYPDTWKTYDFEIDPVDYARNALASDAFELRRNLRKVGKPVDRGEWQITPPTVDAYYDPSLNEMVFPAGILQDPFFDKSFPIAVNLGSIGTVMGHELTHGFDDQGSQFDGAGNLRNWWSEATGKLFKEQTKCVIDQYAAYEAVPGVHLNGELTAGENTADIGGLKLAWNAYREARKGAPARLSADGLTEDQLFFIAYGQSWCNKERPELTELRAKVDPHSPARYRVDGPASDTPAFAEAFACKPGTPMRPAKACLVW